MEERGRDDVEALDLQPVAVVRNRRPQVLWAVLAAIGVVAGVLVVTSAGDDGNQRPGLPVDLGARSRASGGAEAAADSTLGFVTYEPGDDLPRLGGEAAAYRLSGDVEDAQIREVAGALRLDGKVQSDGGSWWVADAGGNGRLDVHAGGGAYWSYFSGHQGCVTPDGGTAGCCGPGEDCEAFSSTGTAVDGCGGTTRDAVVDCSVVPTTLADPCLESGSGAACAPPSAEECQQPDVVCLCGVTDEPVSSEDAKSTPGSVCEGCGSQEGAGSGDCPSAPPKCGSAEDLSCVDDAPPGDDDPVAPLELDAEAEARAVALEVVAAAGADTEGALVTAQPNDQSRTWSVTVEPKLDGIPSGLVSHVEVSEAGLVVAGGGPIGRTEALGPYALLDTHEAIARANDLSSSPSGIDPAPRDAGTDSGGTTTADPAAPDTTVVAPEPCALSDDTSAGCAGATACGPKPCEDGMAEEPTTTVGCTVQPDGSEICEPDCAVLPPVDGTVPAICLPPCPPAEPGEDPACTPPIDPGGGPPPEPVPVDVVPVGVVLVAADHALVLLPATDGSADAYLVPAYRFTAEDGSTVDLPAVADDALVGPSSTETTAPDPIEPAPNPEPGPTPVPQPQPCVVLEEGDSTGTTHTIQTCPTPQPDPGVPDPGGDPAIGVGYYVDIDTQCAGGAFELGGHVWTTDDEAVAGWADPGERHEGGTFTLDAADHGTFVGDSAGELVAEFRALGPAEDIFCTPQPR